MDFQYYDTVRKTIGDQDRFIVTLLVQGTAFTIAALSLIANFHDKLGAGVTFALTIPLFLLTVTLLFAVNLYSSLLGEAIDVAKGIESRLLKDVEKELHLTAMMDRPFFAGGRWGRAVYLISVGILTAMTGIVSVVYAYRWLAGS